MSRTAVKRRKTQQERVEESARRLMDAAIELFAERGYEQTSVAEIGLRAGYSRAMVRERYGSKEALLNALIKSQYEDRLMAPTAEGATALEGIFERIDRLESLRARDARLLRALYVLEFEAVGPVPALRPHIAGWFAWVQSNTVKALLQGQSDGSVKATIDVDDEAEQFVLTAIGIAYRWSLEGDAFDHAEALARWKSRLRRHCGTTRRARRASA
ncbi:MULTISPECIES: TetR/AcrR family transcriptional regulator [Mycobacterium]|uniref:HTH tetR-type domain-containing protein n=2 Tax=Mycobacterium gordonae TaxID=1778 RepID=A0A1A6BIB2_MYCGO|nr:MULTISPECIES: TetR/AcrR family transcriptional regulator [Mycobacterium]MCQ4359959.1 TetR/AcrR family transcriptional regulator [Mycobacterium gordonae]MCV7005192.1 TetR/AcrR family transcriptional regulator [Mycobacterium gordonae]OBS02036.1 hypothetical protein A9W98_17105 [Mycobacterium gordonae]ODR21519.1 hypothetical protein BHQ23_12055 [Mycobacterium gordonae]